jgi:hypothetical protein
MEDSQPAINAQKKNVSQSRFRHIKIKYHYLRQLISEGWCKLVKISTKDQVADIATKILSSTITEYFSKTVLGIYNTDTDAVYVTVDVDQSLHVFEPYCEMPYNDWGVMSTPYNVVVLNNTVVVLSSTYGTVVPNSSMYNTVPNSSMYNTVPNSSMYNTV